jgi:AcrR family transcriptional regulator
VTKTKPSSRYHHGALREALLAAAEKLLRKGGVGALTLRAIAREAGVSHGAPAHHFADLSALLSDLAAAGFQRLADRLKAALEARGGSVRFPIPKAYVRFAMENPALFALMFREERLDAKNPSLREARLVAVAALAEIMGVSGSNPSLGALGAMTAAWSLSHGFAVLASDGRLTPLLRAAPDGTDLDALLEATLAAAADGPTAKSS